MLFFCFEVVFSFTVRPLSPLPSAHTTASCTPPPSVSKQPSPLEGTALPHDVSPESPLVVLSASDLSLRGVEIADTLFVGRLFAPLAGSLFRGQRKLPSVKSPILHYMPTATVEVDYVDDALLQLSLVENESSTRASNLLRIARRNGWYSWAAGATAIGLMASTFYPLWWLNTSVYRVARLRQPVKVKNFNTYTLVANVLGITLGVFAASPLGFRERGIRMIRHAAMYDAVHWNVKVLCFELRSGTFDGAMILRARDEGRVTTHIGEWLENALLIKDGRSVADDPLPFVGEGADATSTLATTRAETAASASDDTSPQVTPSAKSVTSATASERSAAILAQPPSAINAEVVSLLLREIERKRHALASIY